LVRVDYCWRCKDCGEEWSFEEEGWSVYSECDLYAVHVWLDCELTTDTLDSIWDSKEAADKRSKNILSETT
ncbi:hypothetical protein AB9H28_25690, partial [Salmonella enterica subsp. enterica serovar Kentucky]|uniref:hypothetical protein n=1 Tax=Salmonella enterica TaxID=28901 RepID=UPI003F4C4209